MSGGRFPIRHLAGPLLWAMDGSVWASWRVTPVTYPYLDDARKIELHAAIRAALRLVRGEAMLLSLAVGVDPVQVGRRMLDGIDPMRRGWTTLTDATVDTLVDLDLYERVHYLTVRLPDTDTSGWRAGLSAARDSVGAAFGLTPPPISRAERAARAHQAAQLGAQLGRHIRLVPASPADILWMYARASAARSDPAAGANRRARLAPGARVPGRGGAVRGRQPGQPGPATAAASPLLGGRRRGRPGRRPGRLHRVPRLRGAGGHAADVHPPGGRSGSPPPTPWTSRWTGAPGSGLPTTKPRGPAPPARPASWPRRSTSRTATRPARRRSWMPPAPGWIWSCPGWWPTRTSPS
ncbi:MAG: hypothetical protein L0Y54_03400 [Sporichthyaceae bacterium]|nr:hypothetical protein [Sporichthyaceae bacterium]